MTLGLSPFHLAFPVKDLAQARAFYGGVLGCGEGRSDETWVDFDLFGHQVVAHLDPQMESRKHFNPVDGDKVPVPHFGVVLPWEEWQTFAQRLRNREMIFLVEPHIRFPGKVGEQATMFFLDPFGNALEFKAFKDPARLFAK